MRTVFGEGPSIEVGPHGGPYEARGNQGGSVIPAAARALASGGASFVRS
jgi:hypothetical protein